MQRYTQWLTRAALGDEHQDVRYCAAFRAGQYMKCGCGALLALLLLAGSLRPVDGQPLVLAAPEEVGFSSARLMRIDALVQGYVDQQQLAGAVTLVARRGQVVHFEAFGMGDEGVPMRTNAVFRLFSLTKPITCVAAMILYEEGHFQLYDPVADFIPEFAGMKVFAGEGADGLELVEPERAMTIHDLLINTSGLADGDGDTPVDDLYRETGVFGDLEEMGEFCILFGDRSLKGMVHKLGQIPLLYHPGEQWSRSVSADVLGHLVEVVSGMPLDRFCTERIFKPLGMVDTGFYVPAEKLDRFTALYSADPQQGIRLREPPMPSLFATPTTFFSGGVGLVSTTGDYYRFAQMLLNGGQLHGARILSRKTVELMTVNHLWGEYDDGYGFGLGLAVLTDLGHAQGLGSEGSFGWAGASTSSFVVDPREELVAVFMSQLVPDKPYPVIDQFRTLTYQAIVD